MWVGGTTYSTCTACRASACAFQEKRETTQNEYLLSDVSWDVYKFVAVAFEGVGERST